MPWKRKMHHGGTSQQEQVGPSLADEVCAIDEEVSHLTRLKSEPSQRTRASFYTGQKRPISTFKLLSGRESNCSGMGRFSSADCSYTLRKHLPVKGPWCVDDMDSEAYISQFSTDGSLLVGGFRGSHIRIYNAEKKWKIHKDITCKRLRWTVSDIALSPDQRYLTFFQLPTPRGRSRVLALVWLVLNQWRIDVHAYSSLSPTVHIVNVQNAVRESHANITEIHEGLEFSDDDDGFSFGIFSVKFSKDGRELVVGNNNESICIYDLGASKVTERIHAHVADVNVVTFADETSDVLYSGSDDSLCKVWDRRCHKRQKPVGVLTGHLDGITFIDSGGDGHYFISNCKDQTIKLWDLRKMSSTTKDCTPKSYEWDYRWMTYPSEARYLKHPYDQSLATFRGHSVLRTLIRCYFSPMHSTGQRYIYTGSSDQCVYIYDVATGNVVEKLRWHGSIIRDCSWHPYLPTFVSSSWDGYLVRWEATEDDKDPSMLKAGKQRMHPEGYQLSFVL
ncbi:LEC14B protein-like isoform X2 [Phragmites australis]|nr:LEC14B protein-like isoform X2 [Phragmites australis]XP_062211024.1 LEC14B protein-like isoform X2 [Phragmites australis]XP_062211031.1 LEC14B protein-like isoform X2 [Phragmites australis]XP_062211038.1 LEC14B protein-like isoform X2 [Phragmites australis]